MAGLPSSQATDDVRQFHIGVRAAITVAASQRWSSTEGKKCERWGSSRARHECT